MFRSLRTVFPPGGAEKGEPVILRPPVAVTATLDPEDAEDLPDVELLVRAEDIFSVTVGPPAKKTLAGWHVTCPEEIVDSLEHLVELSQIHAN